MRPATCIIVLILLSACSGKLSAEPAPTAQPPQPSAEAAKPSIPITQPTAADRSDPNKKLDGLPSTTTVVASLTLVLGVFFAIVWLIRRTSPPGAGLLPPEAFEVLGRAPLANRQQVHLLRWGNKLLLVSASAAGTETLAEIADAAEVERLTTLCRQSRPNVATTALRQMFGQKGKSNG